MTASSEAGAEPLSWDDQAVQGLEDRLGEDVVRALHALTALPYRSRVQVLEAMRGLLEYPGPHRRPLMSRCRPGCRLCWALEMAEDFEADAKGKQRRGAPWRR